MVTKYKTAKCHFTVNYVRDKVIKYLNLPASVQTFLKSAPLKSSDSLTMASQSEIAHHF